MTAKDLAIVVRGIAPVVRDYVTLGLSALSDRLKAIEDKPARDGRDGAIGPAGEKGMDGAAGERGPEGPAGKDGAPGPPGEPGRDGADGQAGERGADGPEGKAGRDGRDGLTGAPGEKGLDGTSGRDGKDGIDGLGFDDLSVLHDGERGVTFRFVKGDRVKEFALSIPAMIYKGVYLEGQTYVRGDVVTWGGSTWHTETDTTTKPGDGSKDYRLMVKRGRDGKDGTPGPQGKSGAAGKNWNEK
jgi:hypothetical protein